MSKSRILVTGGNGFIGQYTCKELDARGYQPVVLDTRAFTSHLTYVEKHYGDIRDAAAVTEAVAHADGVIHLAGVLGTQETIGNPQPAAQTNILGGLNVLSAAAQYKVPMVNIAVGNYWMDNTYSITKSTVQRFAKMYAKEHGAPVLSVRALNAYGPGQSVAAPYGHSKVRKIIPSFACRALSGAPIEIYGNGQQIMDMVYVGDVARDLVDAYEGLLSGEYEPGSNLESGPGRWTSVLQIANAVIDAAGTTTEIVRLPMRPGEPEDSVVVADEPMGTEYAKLEDILPNTVDFFRSYLKNA